ncbi:MAG: acyltransferase [Burkholderiales bacterium]|nr:MAG: acyltransferase [Burkholderiales bacterium]
MASTSASREPLQALQALRGIAALAVVLMHFKEWMVKFSPGLAAVAQYGYVGVDVFFLISGFIIFHATAAPESRQALPFLIRRLCRVVLPAWVAMALLVLIKPPYLIDLVRGLAFLPRETGHPPYFGHGFLIVAWTLTYELLFYGVFALALATAWSRARRGGVAAALLLAAMLAGQAAAGHFTLDATQTQPVGRSTGVQELSLWPLLTLLSSPMFIEFIVGIGLAAAFAWRGGEPFRRCGGWVVLAGALLTVGGAVWPGLDGHGPTRAGAFAFGVAVLTLGVQARLDAGGWSAARAWISPLAWLGGCSYSLYLFHPLVKAGLQPVVSTLAPAPLAGLTLAALLACIGVAALMHRWVELPAQDFGKRLSRRLATRQSR